MRTKANHFFLLLFFVQKSFLLSFHSHQKLTQHDEVFHQVESNNFPFAQEEEEEEKKNAMSPYFSRFLSFLNQLRRRGRSLVNVLSTLV